MSDDILAFLDKKFGAVQKKKNSTKKEKLPEAKVD